MSNSEKTLVLVKPDGVQRGLIGEIVGRIERKGLRVVALEMRTLDRSTAEQHYAEHDGKPFFGELVEFITSGPLVALVAEGPRAHEAVRALMGVTDPVKSAPGSIRGDYALEEAFTFERLIGVVAVLGDKDVEGVLEPLERVLDEVVVTTNSSPRALPAEELAEIADEVFGDSRVSIAARLDDAIEQAFSLAEADSGVGGGVLVTGSIVTVGDARTLLARRPRRGGDDDI